MAHSSASVYNTCVAFKIGWAAYFFDMYAYICMHLCKYCNIKSHESLCYRQNKYLENSQGKRSVESTEVVKLNQISQITNLIQFHNRQRMSF